VCGLGDFNTFKVEFLFLRERILHHFLILLPSSHICRRDFTWKYPSIH
jgi:hypothetical protein